MRISRSETMAYYKELLAGYTSRSSLLSKLTRSIKEERSLLAILEGTHKQQGSRLFFMYLGDMFSKNDIRSQIQIIKDLEETYKQVKAQN
jgi:hypothetical protein